MQNFLKLICIIWQERFVFTEHQTGKTFCVHWTKILFLYYIQTKKSCEKTCFHQLEQIVQAKTCTEHYSNYMSKGCKYVVIDRNSLPECFPLSASLSALQVTLLPAYLKVTQRIRLKNWLEMYNKCMWHGYMKTAIQAPQYLQNMWWKPNYQHIPTCHDCIQDRAAPTDKQKSVTSEYLCVRKHTLHQGLFGLSKLYGCWCVCSLLVQPPLSHLLLLISMETGPGAFSHIHTLAINQQVRPGSIPTHTHHTDEDKDHTHRNIHTLLDVDHTSRLSGSDLATQFFVYRLLWLWGMTVPPWQRQRTQGDLFPSAVLFFIVWIWCLVGLAIMNGHIEE